MVFDEAFSNTIAHEFQHLIRNLYSNNLGGSEKVGTYDYYSSPTEIQAHSLNIAQKSFDSWKSTWEFAMQKWDSAKQIEKLRQVKTPEFFNNITKVFLMDTIRQFDKGRYNILKSNPDLKKQYIYYSYRNFESMVTKYVDQKIVEINESANAYSV